MGSASPERQLDIVRRILMQQAPLTRSPCCARYGIPRVFLLAVRDDGGRHGSLVAAQGAQGFGGF
jgi:hypothetical protein